MDSPKSKDYYVEGDLIIYGRNLLIAINGTCRSTDFSKGFYGCKFFYNYCKLIRYPELDNLFKDCGRNELRRVPIKFEDIGRVNLFILRYVKMIRIKSLPFKFR